MIIKKGRPIFNKIITTAHIYEEDQYLKGTKVIDTDKPKGALKPYQQVISVGDSVRAVKEGDWISINPMRYAIKKH
jgi:hypothetical protein